jgi:hypothetical protein
MNYYHHPAIPVVAVALGELACRLIAEAQQRYHRATRQRRGGTLRPGSRSPLWNALVLTVRPHLRRWGAKSSLARMLGVPPQRVYEYFKAGSAAPDAERVLRIIVWLSRGAPKLIGPAGRKRWRQRPRDPARRPTPPAGG